MIQADSTWEAYMSDIHLTEKQKQTKEYLQANVDHWILSLSREKKEIRTLRNYYSGIRDEKEFAYLTANFGIGTPSKLKFTNLIKPRVDALVGQTIKESFIYKVACLDDKTISTIEESKKTQLLEGVTQALDKFIEFNIKSTQQKQQPGTGTGLAADMAKIMDKFGTNYLSDYEIAAQDVLKYFSQAVHIDMKQKLKQMAQDLFITGQCYYRVHCDVVGADPVLQVIKPENIFFNKNTNTQYINTSDAVVHREYLTRKEVIRDYGKYMDATQKYDLFGEAATRTTKTGRRLQSGYELDSPMEEDEPYFGQKSLSMFDTIEVYHVEWLALNEVELTEEEREDNLMADGYKTKLQNKTYRVDRYEGTRIGGLVYVNCGKSSTVSRSQARPLDAGFTYGGVLYNDRGGKPYSMVAALKDLQDAYDITIFYRDNLIANSGVPGSRINIAGIPKQLGNNFMQRLMKHIALKKNGFELIDPTEQGAQLFSHYGEFDNSVNGQSLQALDRVLEGMERQADVTAGVNQQLLGQIAERDAVTNVKQGIMQSLLINEDVFELLRSNHLRMLTSMLDTAKVCYKNGKKGSYIAGAESYVFKIAPENFCMTDFAINISYSSADEMKLQTIKELAKEYIAAGILDPDTITHIILSDSATEVKSIISKAWIKKKEENDQLGQAEQTIEQLQQQMQQVQNEFQKAQSQLESNENKNQQLRAQEMELKAKESREKLDNEATKIKNDKDFDDKQIQLKEEVVQLEREQLYMSDGNDKEVKNF